MVKVNNNRFKYFYETDFYHKLVSKLIENQYFEYAKEIIIKSIKLKEKDDMLFYWQELSFIEFFQIDKSIKNIKLLKKIAPKIVSDRLRCRVFTMLYLENKKEETNE